jgi:hypothetical protein
MATPPKNPQLYPVGTNTAANTIGNTVEKIAVIIIPRMGPLSRIYLPKKATTKLKKNRYNKPVDK